MFRVLQLSHMIPPEFHIGVWQLWCIVLRKWKQDGRCNRWARVWAHMCVFNKNHFVLTSSVSPELDLLSPLVNLFHAGAGAGAGADRCILPRISSHRHNDHYWHIRTTCQPVALRDLLQVLHLTVHWQYHSSSKHHHNHCQSKETAARWEVGR